MFVPQQIRIGNRLVGTGQPCYVIAEIGINHNGRQDLLRKLIAAAADAGCDAVKFQKRSIDYVYSREELDRPRESPFGTTNGDLKRALELNHDDYRFIDRTCRELGLQWFASCWDPDSVDFIEQFNVPCHKIASACLTDLALIRHICRSGKPILLSTGMCTIEELDNAVGVVMRAGNPVVVMHCVSTYPSREQDLNLRMLGTLRTAYNELVGYSGHEVGLSTTVAAVAMGACVVERHLTLDRSMFGSDQAASVEPAGFKKLVRYIRTVESAMGDGRKRVLEAEKPIQQKLRRPLTA